MKTIKKTILSFTLVFFMMILPVGDSAGMVTAQAQTMVYVTPTGSKYHTHKCGRGNFYQTTLSNALARGLTPCKKCFGYRADIRRRGNLPRHHEEDNEEKEHQTEDKSAVDQQYKDCACKRTEQETYGKGWCRNRFLGQQ